MSWRARRLRLHSQTGGPAPHRAGRYHAGAAAAPESVAEPDAALCAGRRPAHLPGCGDQRYYRVQINYTSPTLSTEIVLLIPESSAAGAGGPVENRRWMNEGLQRLIAEIHPFWRSARARSGTGNPPPRRLSILAAAARTPGSSPAADNRGGRLHNGSDPLPTSWSDCSADSALP